MMLFIFACNGGGGGDDGGASDDDSLSADDDATDDDDSGDDAIDDDTVDDDAMDDTSDDDTSDDDSADDDATDDTEAVDCPAVITRQPYLQSGTSTSMRVLWRTDQPADSVVEWGPTPDLGDFVVDHAPTQRHDLVIRGLDPGTDYYYKARSCLDESTVAAFHTSPTNGEPFTFVAFSDNQEHFDIFTQIAALMKDEEPQLAISSGDTVDNGWVEDDFDEQLFGPGADVWREAPLYVAIGNHEHLSPYFFNSFHFPNNNKEYYSFTYGNVFFIALAMDTAHICMPGTWQYRFFENALASDEAQNADFRVVFFHTPPWSEGWPGYDGDWMARFFIVPLMEQYGVDVYFNGHTHDYERGLRNGVTSYIIGGAAGGLDTWARDVPHISVYYSIHHFVSVTVDGPTMTLDAIDIGGNLFDTWEITH